MQYYHHYQYAGLWIVSELPLPEWTVFEQMETADKPDVVISLRPAIEFQAGESVITPEEFRFSILEAGTYQVLRGREIIVTPAPEADPVEVRLFLLGTAWGVLCYQRGILALHASVVQVGEGAVAFCGASGMGKSSIAAALVARGYPLISDDLCCFDFAAGAPRVYPSAPRLKLWRDALIQLGWSTDDLVRDHFRFDKFHWTHMLGLQASVELTPLPLDAIHLLEWGDLALTRLTGLHALRRLVAATAYRPGLIEPLGQMGNYWEQCAQLACAAPVWELKRPRDWVMMDATLALLITDWQKKRKLVK